MIACPERGVLRGVVESLAVFDARGDAVVIAANVELRRAKGAHHIEHLIRLRAVADEVAEADDVVELFAADALGHRAQRFGVRVQIADDERSHETLRERRALSRKPFGSSSSSRSTISFGVSSSRTSIVTSHIR